MISLQEYADRVHKANEKWWVNIETGEPLVRNMGEMLMLCTSELAEALEAHRKNLKDDKLPQYDGVKVELVDCFIRLFDIYSAYWDDLDEVFEAKMAFNASREDHTIEHRLTANGKKY